MFSSSRLRQALSLVILGSYLCYCGVGEDDVAVSQQASALTPTTTQSDAEDYYLKGKDYDGGDPSTLDTTCDYTYAPYFYVNTIDQCQYYSHQAKISYCVYYAVHCCGNYCSNLGFTAFTIFPIDCPYTYTLRCGCYCYYG